MDAMRKNKVIFFAKEESPDVNKYVEDIENVIGDIDDLEIFTGGIEELKRYLSEMYDYKKEVKDKTRLIIVFKSIMDLNPKVFDLIEFIVEVRDRYDARLFSLEEKWVYNISDLSEIDWISFKKFLSWIESELINKKRMRQREAWRKGKRKGRPPSIPPNIVRKYVLKYKELALKNKKALWLIMKAEGYKISYRRFLDKVNAVIIELKLSK